MTHTARCDDWLGTAFHLCGWCYWQSRSRLCFLYSIVLAAWSPKFGNKWGSENDHRCMGQLPTPWQWQSITSTHAVARWRKVFTQWHRTANCHNMALAPWPKGGTQWPTLTVYHDPRIHPKLGYPLLRTLSPWVHLKIFNHLWCV